LPARNTLQVKLEYTDPDSYNAQRHRFTDRQTDRQTDDIMTVTADYTVYSKNADRRQQQTLASKADFS